MAKIRLINSIRFRYSVLIISLLIIFVIGNVYFFSLFKKQITSKNKISDIILPSIELFSTLDQINFETYSLTTTIIYNDKDTGSVYRKRLAYLQDVKYYKTINELRWLMQMWNKNIQNQYLTLLTTYDSLLNSENAIKEKLSSFKDYNNTQLMFSIYYQMQSGSELAHLNKSVHYQIQKIINDLEDDISKIMKNSNLIYTRLKKFFIWYTLIIIIFTAIISYIINKNTLFFTNVINDIIKKMRKGELPEFHLKKQQNNEIGELAGNITGLVDYLKELSEVAEKIGKNDFDITFKPLSEHDVLGNALLRMRDNLLKAEKEQQLRQKENAERSWTSQGIGLFNEIIRDNSKDLDMLTKAVIKHLVEYTGAHIGGLFIADQETNEEFIELKAFYAYDRHKYIEQKIKPGETLVGQCYLEKETIYINDVPDDYMYITSGLGSDKPKSILIVPLQFNEITFGIVELASFEEFPKYKIEFVERIGETIASAISTVKINDRTAKLLQESNEKSRRLEQQEKAAKQQIEKIQEEMKAMMKELEEVKDEKEKFKKLLNETNNKMLQLEQQLEKEKAEERRKYITLLEAMNKVIPHYTMSPIGDITYANDLYLSLLNLPGQEVIGKRHSNYLFNDYITSGNYKKIWDRLKKGEIVDTSVQYFIDGKSKFVTEKFIPVLNDKNELTSVYVFGI